MYSKINCSWIKYQYFSRQRAPFFTHRSSTFLTRFNVDFVYFLHSLSLSGLLSLFLFSVPCYSLFFDFVRALHSPQCECSSSKFIANRKMCWERKVCAISRFCCSVDLLLLLSYVFILFYFIWYFSFFFSLPCSSYMTFSRTRTVPIESQTLSYTIFAHYYPFLKCRRHSENKDKSTEIAREKHTNATQRSTTNRQHQECRIIYRTNLWSL